MIIAFCQEIILLTRTILKNGIVVLFMPYPSLNRVAVESFYRAGFVHEPEGMTQSAHLLEHLVCYGATRSYKAGESFNLLNRRGTANAETMGSFTHYDYLLPSGEMELAFKIEAERLSSLKITPELIQQEAPRCHQEAVNVENVPQAGMFKFGMMAINQGWRYHAKQAKVRSGLEHTSVKRLNDFHRMTYRPDRFILVVAGGFNQEKAIKLLNRHLGVLKSSASGVKLPPIDWTRMPGELTIRWDSRTRVVGIAFPPPAGAKERFLMTLWGQVMMMREMSSRALASLTDAYFCTNIAWSTGDMPFFLYATAKPGVELSDLQSAMLEQLNAVVSTPPTPSDVAQVRMMANEIETSLNMNETILQARIQQMKQMAGSETRAVDLAIGNLAILIGMYELVFGNQRKAILNDMRRLNSTDLHHLIKQTLLPAKRSIIRLT